MGVMLTLGTQWGDEGKGKWIDALAQDCDFVVRFQGGNNAGHTLYHRDKKFVLHHLPSGVFHERPKLLLGAGMVVNPSALLEELGQTSEFVDWKSNKLWISPRVHLVTPFHITLDSQHETSGKGSIGTTKRGIGPAYGDKAHRCGLTLGMALAAKGREQWHSRATNLNSNLEQHLESKSSDWDSFWKAVEQLRPFVKDVEHELRLKTSSQFYSTNQVLIEGAQGSLLDLDHGTYPFVTSSSTNSGGAAASLGIPPQRVKEVYGIAKAYITRVGSGPFPTEISDTTAKTIATKGHEFGATTNRPRRIGWFDGVAMKYVKEMNDLKGLYLNKLDILTGIETLKIAIAYQHPKLGKVHNMPSENFLLEECTPIYEEFTGWTEDITGVQSLKDLPKNAQKFIEAISSVSQIKLKAVGTGPGREDAILF